MTSIIEKRTVRTPISRQRTERSQVETAPAVEWTEMGQGVWVAKRAGDFAGLIEELWGAGYRVTDRTGAIVGEFATLQSARRQLQ